MRRLHLLLIPVCVVLALPAAVSAKEPPGKKKSSAPKLDLGLGDIGGEIPKAEGLTRPEHKQERVGPQVTTRDVKYEVVKVEHAARFTPSASGARAEGGVLKAVKLSGTPPTLQPFATRVRVKATQKLNASIELVILDPRGDTALSGSGELVFSENGGDEVDYLLDWAPVARPAGGEYQLLVRIGGRPMGTWPLRVQKD